jgi:hypothetical protein
MKKKTNVKAKQLYANKSLDEESSISNSNFSSKNSIKPRQKSQINESLGGLVLSAKDLSYNGLELSDPVVRMHTKFHAYVPSDTQNDRYLNTFYISEKFDSRSIIFCILCMI